MSRCFIGLELSENSRKKLKRVVRPLYKKLSQGEGFPLRLVVAENWHMTLLFFRRLEAQDRALVWSKVAQSVGEGGWKHRDFIWNGLAVWPSPRKAGLICLEAENYPGAKNWPLAGWLETSPFNKGDTSHFSPFRPHVTLIRVKRGKERPKPYQWREAREDFPPVDPISIKFDRISLFISSLSKENPIYPREHTLKI